MDIKWITNLMIKMYYLLTYLRYGTTVLEKLWPPSNEGFFIYFSFSYTYFLLEAEWCVIVHRLMSLLDKELLGRDTPIKFCSDVYFFQVWGSLRRICARNFYALKKSTELNRVWTVNLGSRGEHVITQVNWLKFI